MRQHDGVGGPDASPLCFAAETTCRVGEAVAAEDSLGPFVSRVGTDSPTSRASGVKGRMAREAVIRVAIDFHKVVQVTADNAALDLAPEQRGPGMMQDYVEKKIP